MSNNYIEMKSFLDDNNVTHEEMQERWDSIKESNPIVKNLSEHGKNWTDLNEMLLKSLIKLTEPSNA